VVGRHMALLLAVVVACAVVPESHAVAAPLPAAWCGADESPGDRPDLVVGRQIHVVYAYPTDFPDRFDDMVRSIARDLAGVDTWWQSQDPLRTPRFDLAAFPNCNSEFGDLDVSSVPLTFDSTVYDPEGDGDFTPRLVDDFTKNGLDNDNKKYLVFYDGPAGGGICGRSASSATTGGARSASLVFLQGDPGCRVGGYGTGNGWPARTAAHELLHALNDYFGPDTAPNACDDRGHVCDSDADILSTGTSHPSPRLSDAVLDVGRDDYYGHGGSWWDIRNSEWLVHLDSPPGILTVSVAGTGGTIVTTPDGTACADSCARRYDGGSPVRLDAVEHAGFRLLSWGGACSGAARACETTVSSAGTTVTATFGPAVTVAAHTSGPGKIAQLDAAWCVGKCDVDLIPGSQVVFRAQPEPNGRFVGWHGLCRGSRPTCTVAVSRGAVHPTVTAVFRHPSRRA
jgi:hypothetical protein